MRNLSETWQRNKNGRVVAELQHVALFKIWRRWISWFLARADSSWFSPGIKQQTDRHTTHLYYYSHKIFIFIKKNVLQFYMMTWQNRIVYIMILIPKYLIVFLFHISISTLSLLTFSSTHEHSIWMAKQINKEILKCGRECMRIEFMSARVWIRNLDPINLTIQLIIILEISFRLTLTIFNKLFEMRCCLIQRINGGFWLRKR